MSLIIIESLLDDFKYDQSDFFQEVINNALEINLISEEKYLNIIKEFSSVIISYVLDICNEASFEINDVKEIIISNHFYFISLYLSKNYKPSEAYSVLFENTFAKLHRKAVNYFEQQISASYFKLDEINKKRGKFLTSNYLIVQCKEIIVSLKNVLRYDFDIIDVKNYQLIVSYPLMSEFDFVNFDSFDRITKYVDYFIIEMEIRSIFSRDIIKKVKDIQKEEKYSYLFKQQWDIELDNVLVNVLSELLIVLIGLKEEKFEVPTNKKLYIKENYEDLIDTLFEFEEIYSFTEEQKEYIKKYLKSNL